MQIETPEFIYLLYVFSDKIYLRLHTNMRSFNHFYRFASDHKFHHINSSTFSSELEFTQLIGPEPRHFKLTFRTGIFQRTTQENCIRDALLLEQNKAQLFKEEPIQCK